MNPALSRAFVERETQLTTTPLLPEVRLHLATSVTPLWHATEAHLADFGIEPPFWAFAWAGGQGIARAILDRPELVRGHDVIDLASGSGLVAIAAAMAGARRVIAVEVDPLAIAAIGLNAAANGVAIDARLVDVLSLVDDPPWISSSSVVLAGDVCYDRAMAARVMPWLRARARAGATVLLGDPGRAYLDEEGLVEIARSRVPTIDDVEGQTEKTSVVYRLISSGSSRA